MLVAFHHATNGPDWTTSTNWLTRKPLRTWWGVETDMAGRVKGLSLQDNLLSDSLPPELGRLTELRWLDLSYNHLSGPLPPELGQLANLEELDLNWNYLSGSLPPELGRLLKLEELYLSNNRLCGPLPPELGRLDRLEIVDLSRNDLTGRVPSEWLKNLTGVDLSGNRLAGFADEGRRHVRVDQDRDG